MLLPTRDDCTQAIWHDRYLTGGDRVLRADFERHRDRHLAMRAFRHAHKAMTRAILSPPRIIVQLTELPGTQCLHRHKISEHKLTRDTGKARL